MAQYTVQTVTRDGIEPTENPVAASDVFNNDGNVRLWVDNQNAGTCTVTIVTQATVDGQAVSDKTVAIPTGEKRLIGPFPPGVYNDDNSQVTVQFSVTSNVTCACFK